MGFDDYLVEAGRVLEAGGRDVPGAGAADRGAGPRPGHRPVKAAVHVAGLTIAYHTD